MDKQYTIAQASERFGIPERTIRAWISGGQVEFTRFGPRSTLITEAQLKTRKIKPMGRKGWTKKSKKQWEGICTRS